MIYGEIISDKNYYDFYPELLELIQRNFENVEAGVQGDAYIWIMNENEKIALDTFTSMRFQIKSNRYGGTLLESVIQLLESKLSVYMYEKPEIEVNDDLSNHT